MLTIKDLNIQESGKVISIGGEGALRQHILDMGITPGAEVRLVKRAPLGDPLEIEVRGYSMTLRITEASSIQVEHIPQSLNAPEQGVDEDFSYNLSLHEHNAHPGYGEEGKYHSRDHENPLPKGTTLSFALVGQQNCGKTTLFNRLTGSSQHVGNFPGVTVDRKDGVIHGYPDTVVTDLPGVYSLSTYTAEELVTRNFILGEKPKAIINIVDAGNIERNLYLTVQLMELDVPMVLVLNMMDELQGNGGKIRLNELEKELGLPVVPIAAARGDGVAELVEHAVHTAKYQEAPVRHDFCDPDDFGGAVHRCLHSIMALVEDHALAAGLPIRFTASRLTEGDPEILSRLKLTDDEKNTLESIISHMEEERGMDRHAAMADMRFNFIHRLCEKTVRRPRESKELLRSRRIDRILTGRWTAIPAFIACIGAIFLLTFDVIGAALQNLLQNGIDTLSDLVEGALTSWNVSEVVRSLVVDAVFGGVGSVLSFVPIIIVLFFFLSLLEDSGYMARIAFVSDSLLRKTGLSGRSIVPMLIGWGCSVPAVMASRTLPSSHDRRLTILLIPFMSCSAKLAIYGFLASAFFPGHAGLVMVALYLLGIIVGVICAVVAKLVRRHTEAAPFVMELPVYRLPIARNVAHLLWDKTKDFVQRAFTVIFVATIVIWFLQSFDVRMNYVDSADSMLASLAGWMAPVMSPLGLGDWRIVTSLISGFLAKESVVATMEMLGVSGILTTASAAAMLVFCLLYTPCIAAIAAIRRELGTLWSAFTVVFQCIVAWICAFGAYMLFL